MSVAIAVLIFVTVQRLAELVWAKRNADELMRRGAREFAPEHYPFLVTLHFSWLVGLWFLAPGSPVNWYWLAVYGLLQLLRFWVLISLKERWTTRIIVLPNAPLVRAGPYRWLNHPNYLVVASEILVLPLVFGLVVYALIFSALNCLLLTIRIRAENKALAR
jgi:methyltransferase